VRRVLEAEVKNEILRLTVQRLGQAKPTKLEICRERDRRTPHREARRARGVASAATGGAAPLSWLYREPAELVDGFGAIFWAGVRARLVTQRAICFCRAGPERTGDAGFHRCGAEVRHSVARCLTRCESWKVRRRRAEAVSAGGASALIRERMAHLNAEAAKWQRYELEEREDNLKELDIADCGNVATRLVRSTDESATHARFAAAYDQVRKLMCEAEIAT
jgi:hypothetical protein